MTLDFAQIAAFLDVVKDPVKYEQVLKQFEEREARWKELVEAHTKVSNVDKFVKAAEKKAADLEKKAAEVLADAEAQKAKMVAYYQEMVKEQEDRKAVTAKLEEVARQAAKEAETIKFNLTQALSLAESEKKNVLASKQEVEQLKKELQEKLTKLKALAA